MFFLYFCRDFLRFDCNVSDQKGEVFILCHTHKKLKHFL
jgi:hypothetical protein